MDSRIKPISYEGKEPYIFISYAHKDEEDVLPAIVALQQAGYRVWYDAGIQAGTEWPENIANHLLGSTLVIAFISKNAIASDHCRQEITYTISKKISMLTVRLDDSPLPPGVEMQLNLRQTLNAYLHPSKESFIAELVKARYISAIFSNVGGTNHTPSGGGAPQWNGVGTVADTQRQSSSAKLRKYAEEAYQEAMNHLQCGTVEGYRQAIEIYNTKICRAEIDGTRYDDMPTGDLQERFCATVFDEAMRLPANSSKAKHLFGALPPFYHRQQNAHCASEYVELINKHQKKTARTVMIPAGVLLVLLSIFVYRVAFSLSYFWLVRVLFACFPMLVTGIIGNIMGRKAPDRDDAFNITVYFFSYRLL